MSELEFYTTEIFSLLILLNEVEKNNKAKAFRDATFHCSLLNPHSKETLKPSDFLPRSAESKAEGLNHNLAMLKAMAQKTKKQ